MRVFTKILMGMTVLGIVAGCGKKQDDFKYLLDEFADLKVMRYQVPGWEELSLQQKEYAYHLAEAAKYGRDILWDQNCRINLPLRHVVTNILENYKGDRDCKDFQDFLVYAKRLYFSNGIHHHYAEDKFVPDCPEAYFAALMEAVGEGDKAAWQNTVESALKSADYNEMLNSYASGIHFNTSVYTDING